MNLNEIEIARLNRDKEAMQQTINDLTESLNNVQTASLQEGYVTGYQEGYRDAKAESKAFIKDLFREIQI